MAWALPEHVHFCIAAGRVVFLDTRRDRYFALPEAASETFQSWCATSARAPLPAPLLVLEREGLLFGSARRSAVRATAHAAPSKEAADRRSWRAAFNHAPTNLGALITVRRALRQGLQTALDRITPPTRPDVAAQDLLPAYLWTRDRLPRRPKCLFDSLALLDFLHAENAAATIVLGIKAVPFAAHCWVEHRGVVLNDRLDRVATFTPILAR